MNTPTSPTAESTTSVKVETVVYDKVMDNKKRTGVSVQKFFSQAATEKLEFAERQERTWDYLCKKLKAAGIDDNNYTARLIHDYIFQ